MRKKLLSAILAAAMSVSLFGCGDTRDTADDSPVEIATETTTIENYSKEDAETLFSPMETIKITTGSQVTVQKEIILRHEGDENDGRNMYKLPLADFIQEGDYINSFTFVVESSSGNIGEFKGAYGITVAEDCPSATSSCFHQTPDFTEGTNGGYAELTWNVPNEIADYVTPNGDVMFGYWWGDAEIIKLGYVICTFTRTKNVPYKGTESKDIGETKIRRSDNEDGDHLFRIKNDFLPVGGESTHAVLTAHNGLISRRLFTDLWKMKEGDRFVIHVLKEKLVYEVDRIKTVKPDELGDLCIEEGKDLVTLLTCTPYGVNTDRLLVRGHRVAENEVSAGISANAEMINKYAEAAVISFIPLLIIIIVLVIKLKKTVSTE